MKTKKIWYKVDKGVLVTKEIIVTLLNQYNYYYPKKITQKMMELIDILEKEVNNDINYRKYDITDFQLYEEVSLIENGLERKHHGT
mgnify:FL=1